MVAFATQVKRRRGTTAQNDAFTGAEGEIVVDTQKHTLRVHDGETLGGFEMATMGSLSDKADVVYVDERLATKADTDLGNITNVGRANIAGLGMPSDTPTDLTLGSSGSTYVAPADGWFYATKTVNANAEQYIIVLNANAPIGGAQSATGNGAIVRAFVPVKKGDTVRVTYNAGGAGTLKFIYAEGTKHLA